MGFLCLTQAARKNFSDDHQRVVSESVFEGEYAHVVVRRWFELNGDTRAQFLRESFYFFYYGQAMRRVAGNLERFLNLPPFITGALDQILNRRQASRERPRRHAGLTLAETLDHLAAQLFRFALRRVNEPGEA